MKFKITTGLGLDIETDRYSMGTGLNGQHGKRYVIDALIADMAGEYGLAKEVVKKHPEKVAAVQAALKEVDRHLKELKALLTPPLRDLNAAIVQVEKEYYEEDRQ